MDGIIPLDVADSGTTSNAGKYGNGLHLTGRSSHKVFKVSTGHETQATTAEIMEHKLRKPARMFNMVPGVIITVLSNTSKFCNVGYVTIFNGDEVNIYDMETTTITASKKPILKGWRNCGSTMWRIPILK